MKFNPLYLVVFIISLFFFFAFGNRTNEISNSISGDIERDTVSFQISAENARNYVDDYKDYVGAVNDSLSNDVSLGFSNSREKLIYGAEVDLKELRRILLNSKPSEKNSLYAMNGIMSNGDTEIIFALSSVDTIEAPTDTTWSYFDFTRPCPAFCPSWLEVE